MKATPTIPPPPRQRLLAAADDLFRRFGIRGVGVEAIAEAADTNKMTLYRHFESKDELVAEWVRGIIAHKEASWNAIAERNVGNPGGQLIEWAKATATKFADIEERGSAIHNALAELPATDHPARVVIDQHRLKEHKLIAKLCREAGFPEPELAADEMYFLIEGAKACAPSIGLKRVGEHLVKLVTTLVATHGKAKRK
ncbi:MAG TPA: TetR/AcrR family transcriptional regulator [Gemmatimonadaceae bacterium]|jgi:AcrR family transcriptional regulator